MAESLGRDLGQSVVVENAAGGGGTIGALRVAQARPDGHTLLLHNLGMATAPTLYRKLPYDPVADFACIGLITAVPMVWVARPDFPPRDFAATLEHIRQHRQGVNLAHAGLGSGSQLCGTLLQAQLRAPMTAIVFRGTGPIYPELLGNRVDLVCDQTTVPSRRYRVAGYAPWPWPRRSGCRSCRTCPPPPRQGCQASR